MQQQQINSPHISQKQNKTMLTVNQGVKRRGRNNHKKTDKENTKNKRIRNYCAGTAAASVDFQFPDQMKTSLIAVNKCCTLTTDSENS